MIKPEKIYFCLQTYLALLQGFVITFLLSWFGWLSFFYESAKAQLPLLSGIPSDSPAVAVFLFFVWISFKPICRIFKYLNSHNQPPPTLNRDNKALTIETKPNSEDQIKDLISQSNSGIDFIYNNEFEAAIDIIYNSDNSDYVKCLSIRGNRFVSDDRETNKILSSDRKYKEIFIMVSDPNGNSCKHRSISFVNPITHHSSTEYQNDVKKVINKLKKISIKNDKIKIRLHCQPESFRLIITHKYLFLSFYPIGVSASSSRVFRISRDSELYKAFSCYFDWAWDNSEEP